MDGSSIATLSVAFGFGAWILLGLQPGISRLAKLDKKKKAAEADKIAHYSQGDLRDRLNGLGAAGCRLSKA